MAAADVIAAIATPPGRGGIGVVRISGPDLAPLARSLLGEVPPPRRASLRDFRDEKGEVIDQGIALYFPAPHSYTGENVLELHGHGGPTVLNLVLQRCLALGARLAEPGEFTKRAFLNGKLDLAQAESVADLIDATTAQAARSAARSLQGEFSAAVGALVEGLTELRAWVEASLDFPEEEIEFISAADTRGRLGALRQRLATVFSQAHQGSLLREGVQVVLAGRPNVGKSSLLNRLAQEEVAIVTDVPGTTRDAIRQAIEIGGVPFHIVDTAGLRQTEDVVEKIGVERTRAAIESADVVLLVVDAAEGFTVQDQVIAAALPETVPRLTLYNKNDLVGGEPRVEEKEGGAEIHLSAKTGEGIELLKQKLLEAVGWRPTEEGVFMARARHLAALSQAREHLEAAEAELLRPELFAEELRAAQQALAAITGEVTADDLLGEIFSRFCIGK